MWYTISLIEMKVILIAFLSVLAVLADDAAVQQLINGNHLFSADVYKELLKTEQGNFLVSSFSVETVLALTEEGAKGETAEQLKNGLHLPKTKETINAAFKTILENFNNKSKDYQLLTANKIYVNKDFSINKNFQGVAKSVFKSEVENVNFAENTKTANEINKWVEEQTNSKINEIISADGLVDVRALLVNTLYFNGSWEKQFSDRITRKQEFHVSENETVDVDTMFLNDRFLFYYSQELDAKFLKLPYKGGNISMTIVLPNKIDGLGDLEKNKNFIKQLFNVANYSKRAVNLSLPKLKIESAIQFVPILQELGIRTAFDKNNADFSGLTTNQEHLYISNVVQKTYINVNEKGTEAAAATAVSVSTTSVILPQEQFIVDHPFLFYIEINNLILFIGRVTNPNRTS